MSWGGARPRASAKALEQAKLLRPLNQEPTEAFDWAVSLDVKRDLLHAGLPLGDIVKMLELREHPPLRFGGPKSRLRIVGLR